MIQEDQTNNNDSSPSERAKSGLPFIEISEIAENVMSVGEINLNVNSDTEPVALTESEVRQVEVEFDDYINGMEKDGPYQLKTQNKVGQIQPDTMLERSNLLRFNESRQNMNTTPLPITLNPVIMSSNNYRALA